MNSYLKMLVHALLYFSCFAAPQCLLAQQATKQPVKVIFDTDMGPDYDDIGAIAMLHALADQGELEILASLASDAHVDIAPTIDLFNRYFGRPAIPIGEADRALAPNFTAKTDWGDKLIRQFEPSLKNKRYTPAVDVYRKVLAAQPDQSVTLITVGFMTNIAQLMASGADAYSDLSGMELINKKVKLWVCMAGGFPQGREFNVFKDEKSSYAVFPHFPRPILFTGVELGRHIKTGGKVAATKDSSNPVSVGYQINLPVYLDKPDTDRSSWDQTAVLIAARNPEQYFYVSGPGKFKVEKDGSNTWEPTEEGQHRFIMHKYPYQVIADVLDELMLHRPKK